MNGSFAAATKRLVFFHWMMLIHSYANSAEHRDDILIEKWTKKKVN